MMLVARGAARYRYEEIIIRAIGPLSRCVQITAADERRKVANGTLRVVFVADCVVPDGRPTEIVGGRGDETAVTRTGQKRRRVPRPRTGRTITGRVADGREKTTTTIIRWSARAAVYTTVSSVPNQMTGPARNSITGPPPPRRKVRITHPHLPASCRSPPFAALRRPPLYTAPELGGACPADTPTPDRRHTHTPHHRHWPRRARALDSIRASPAPPRVVPTN